MSRRFYSLAFVALALGLAAPATFGQSAGEQIVAALERYRLAVLRTDVESEVASFTENGELSEGNEPIMQGRTTIRSLLNARRAAKIVAYELHAVATRVEVSSAVQNGFFSQRIISPHQEALEVKGVFEVQWLRQSDGSWLIGRLHTDPVQHDAT